MPCHPCLSCFPKREERKKSTATAKEESAPLIAYKKTEAVEQGHKAAVVDASSDAYQPPICRSTVCVVKPDVNPLEAVYPNFMPSPDGHAQPIALGCSLSSEQPFDGNEIAALEQQIVPFTAAESGIDGSAASSTESKQEDACTKTLRDLFRQLDLDGNGQITKIEMIKVVREKPDIAKMLGLPQTVQQEDGTRAKFEQWFQAIDVDDNRSIDWEEFRSHFYPQFLVYLCTLYSLSTGNAVPRTEPEEEAADANVMPGSAAPEEAAELEECPPQLRRTDPVLFRGGHGSVTDSDIVASGRSQHEARRAGVRSRPHALLGLRSALLHSLS